MATKLECKIGTGVHDLMVSGTKNSVIIKLAWDRRRRFNELAKNSPSFWKREMLTSSPNGYEVGLV